MKTEFVSAITQLCNEKGVPRGVVMEAIEAALVSAYRRNFDKPNQDLSAKIDESTGEVHIFWHRKVTSIEPPPPPEPSPAVESAEGAPYDATAGLGEPAEPVYETITVEDAQQIDSKLGEGDSLTVDVTPQQFGRIAAQTAKQVVMQKLREAERKMVYDEFQEREGEIVHGIVQRLEQGNVIVELGRAEAVMPRSEQVPSERYYPGQRLRVYVSEVNETYRGPQIIVSRGHRLMLRRLLEQEVPEIYSGTVEIKAIAREGGARSKVAVVAHQVGIDPVGSCVGMRGVRIQNIVNELNGEKIDVVEWNEDVKQYVANALSPAQVSSVDTNDDEKTATVVVPERQLSLAIGKEGQNARLAAKLTGWRIDIKSDIQTVEEVTGTPAEAAPSSVSAEVVDAESVASGGSGVERDADELRGGVAQRHIPERTCAACRTQRAKRELIRLVRTADQTVKVDLTGKLPGRGAYLCHDPRCWSTALKRNALSGALKTELRAEDRELLLQFASSLADEREALTTGGEQV